MFTGLIENIGEVISSRSTAGGKTLNISMDFDQPLATGESIAVDGACLTVTDIESGAFRADVSRETLKRTTLGNLRSGAKVNLERALRADSRLGGHFLQGHIDCVGRVVRKVNRGDYANLEIAFPRDYIDLVVEKGSIAVSGVSLTIAQTKSNKIEIALIPETIKRTTLGNLKPGNSINLEFDMLAKYIRKQMGYNVT